MRINLDASHGSNTSGKRTVKGYREHTFSTLVCYKIEEILKEYEVDIHKTGWDDKNYSNDPDTALNIRTDLIKMNKCDYSISIHCNAHGDGKRYTNAEGIEIFIHDIFPAKSKELAQTVLKELLKGTPQKNRGVKSAKLAMCNTHSTGCKGSILIELAFMTNEREEALLTSDKYLTECAKEIATALINYLGLKKKGISPSKIYKVQVGAFSTKEKAQETIKKLNSAGFDGIIVEVSK